MAGQPGRQGRKPKASTIARLLADGGQDPPGSLPPPAYLSRRAKVEWRRMVKHLTAAGVLSVLDTVALATYCATFARWVEAQAILDGPEDYCQACDPREKRKPKDRPRCTTKGGHTGRPFGSVISGRLGLTPSPYLKVAQDALVQISRQLAEFGMTPASRARLPQVATPSVRKLHPVAPVQPGIDPRDLLLMENGKGG